MEDTFQMGLCNITSGLVNWSVTPAGGEPILLDQISNEYGFIQVPFSEHYLIVGGDFSQESNSPSVLAVFTGSEIIICTPA